MKTQTAPTNAETIANIPPEFISDADRATYLKRAEAGEDVYAYTSSHDQTGLPIINLWDTDTRIVCPLIATAWKLIDVRKAGAHDAFGWLVTYQDAASSGILHLCMFATHQDAEPESSCNVHMLALRVVPHPHLPTSQNECYDGYARRRILDVLNHCSRFGGDPKDFNGATR